MAAQVRERVPARILHRPEDGGEDQSSVDLTARRFMGVLKHPVPLREMLRHCGVNHRGYKVVADWPLGMIDSTFIRPGDSLQVDGSAYPVYGVKVVPGIDVEIYIGDA